MPHPAASPSEPPPITPPVVEIPEVGDDAGTSEPSAPVRSVSTFNRATCALLEDGSVRCWGDNTWGQLGDGTFENRLRPVQVRELQSVVQLDVGLLRACAVMQDGQLRCWGDNTWDVMRVGDEEDHNLPVTVQGVERAVQVSLGEHQTCVRRSDSTLECWGYPHRTELNVQGERDVVDVEAGYFLTTATLADGSVRSWGMNSLAGQIDVASSRAVSSGYGFVCTLAQDASVRCKGIYIVRDEVGVPVDGVVQGLRSIASMSSGFEHSCAVTQQGKVYCWGRNNRGQLGDGSTTHSLEAREVVGLDHVVEVTCGREHSCAHKADGSVYCWGSNDLGELGDGTTTERHTPVAVIGL
ncbi:MAG TPA: hypothetical protein VJR89_15845 [Polyangiales bacterium]|nr:hypothetical protein [Polyangiales bacterium]